MNAYELAKYLYRLNGYMDMPRDILDITHPSADMLIKLADRIAELEKEVKSVTEQGENFWQQLCELKAHPHKQLSDEEIEEIIRKHWNREYGNRNMMTFARAIIKEITE